MPGAKLSRNDLFVVIAVAIWGASNPLVKFALYEISPNAFVGVRLILSSFLMLGALQRSEKSLRTNRADFFKFSLLGLFGYGIFHPLFTAGLKYSTASDCGIIMALSPLFGVIISLLMGMEKVTRNHFIGILISLVGVSILIGKDLPDIRNRSAHFIGNLFFLGAVISFAFYTVLAGPVLAKNSPLKVSAYAIVMGTIFSLPLTMRPMAEQNWPALSATAWIIVGFSAAMANCVSYTLWYRAVSKIGPARTMIYHNLVPVVTILLAIPILGEAVSRYQLLGAAVAISGIYIARRG